MNTAPCSLLECISSTVSRHSPQSLENSIGSYFLSSEEFFRWKKGERHGRAAFSTTVDTGENFSPVNQSIVSHSRLLKTSCPLSRPAQFSRSFEQLESKGKQSSIPSHDAQRSAPGNERRCSAGIRTGAGRRRRRAAGKCRRKRGGESSERGLFGISLGVSLRESPC